MTEKVAAIPSGARLKIKTEYFLYLLVFLIPFQQRLYKFLRPLSLSFIDQKWNVPGYFEVHLDAFISDFVLLGLILWCLKKVQWRSFWDKESKYLSLFLFFALASIINSDFAAYPIPYWRWLHLALPSFLFFFLSRTHLEEGSFRKIAKITMVVALVECLVAILQYFFQHSVGLKFLGEPTLIAKNYVGSHFPMADGSIWILDRFFHVVRENAFVLRASGTLTHPNILGGFMVFGLLMTYYIYGAAKKRGWLSFAILLQIFCLFITYSRAAIFTAALMTLVWIVATSLREKKLSSLIWVSAGSSLLCLALLYPQIFHRGGIVSYNVVSQSSDTLRMTVADVGFAMFKAHPFLGIGFNNYMLVFPHFAKDIPATYIHNVYLHFGVEVGLVGALSFLTFCLLVLIRGWKNCHKPEVLTVLCIFMGLLVISFADFYPLCQQEIRLVFFLAAGFLASEAVAKRQLINDRSHR
jgi:O-antigen ligase